MPAPCIEAVTYNGRLWEEGSWGNMQNADVSRVAIEIESHVRVTAGVLCWSRLTLLLDAVIPSSVTSSSFQTTTAHICHSSAAPRIGQYESRDIPMFT